MIYSLIQAKKNAWIQSDDCAVKGLLAYMRQRGQLRDAQIEAIETYLFLKLAGSNRSLPHLFTEGVFFDPVDLGKLALTERARQVLSENVAAQSLFQFARMRSNGGSLLPELEKAIVNSPDSVDYADVIRRIFYNVAYPDYLFSLPMGAGKTFLIAAIIYLDLYFALQEPENPLFAHNFIVLAPSGLMSSIVPSLKAIERFDPTWVLPGNAGAEVKRLIHFEVLDQPKSAKKSNRARNPNAQKVNALISQPDPMGLVFVVNAEKVILDRLELSEQYELIEKTDDERARSANELRHLLGRVPNLGIHIDEVHHATADDIKLRQVVNQWSRDGTVTTVMGYSGTPYLAGVERVRANGGMELRFKQITNTVYYYPLVLAIRRFLKKPKIQTGRGLPPLEIIRKGVEEFYTLYGERTYGDGSCAKLAIYCGSIERLEEEIYPFLRDELKIPADDILKYHKGNKRHKPAADSELQFASLDTPISKKRVILLVQIGKEGWDCRSLTGVILAQRGDSPTNMVLQTTCRCLRQVDRGQHETALIWLNEDNVKYLDKQLGEEQQTSVQEINALTRGEEPAAIPRYARAEHLRLPAIDFYQLHIRYEAISVEEAPDASARLADLLADLDRYRTFAQVQTGAVVGETASRLAFDDVSVVSDVAGETARLDFWLAQIAKESFGTLALAELNRCRPQLAPIFDAITVAQGGRRRFNELHDQARVRSAVRLAFSPKRELQTFEEVIPQSAQLLLAAKLDATADKNLYPPQEDVALILKADASGRTVAQIEEDHARAQAQMQTLQEQMLKQFAGTLFGVLQMPPLPDLSLAVRSKEHTFHYLPYSFAQSKLERSFIEECLKLDLFKARGLEIYYNGERGLTEFVIACYQRKNGFWKRLGNYTPDFLLLQRTPAGEAHKVLIVETKGRGFEQAFAGRRQYVETDFLHLNAEHFGYARFDFLYIREDDSPEQNVAKLAEKINAFFAIPQSSALSP